MFFASFVNRIICWPPCIPLVSCNNNYSMVVHKKPKPANGAATAHVELEDFALPDGSSDGFDSASDEEHDEQSEPDSLGLPSDTSDDEAGDDFDGGHGGRFSDPSASDSDMERDIVDIARTGEETNDGVAGARYVDVDVVDGRWCAYAVCTQCGALSTQCGPWQRFL